MMDEEPAFKRRNLHRTLGLTTADGKPLGFRAPSNSPSALSSMTERPIKPSAVSFVAEDEDAVQVLAHPGQMDYHGPGHLATSTRQWRRCTPYNLSSVLPQILGSKSAEGDDSEGMDEGRPAQRRCNYPAPMQNEEPARVRWLPSTEGDANMQSMDVFSAAEFSISAAVISEDGEGSNKWELPDPTHSNGSNPNADNEVLAAACGMMVDLQPFAMDPPCTSAEVREGLSAGDFFEYKPNTDSVDNGGFDSATPPAIRIDSSYMCLEERDSSPAEHKTRTPLATIPRDNTLPSGGSGNGEGEDAADEELGNHIFTGEHHNEDYHLIESMIRGIEDSEASHMTAPFFK